MVSRFAFAAVAMLALSSGASAQDQGPVGIAFVEAPEMSSGVCTAGNPDAGFACARAKCMESGAQARDCLRVAWCFPSGWSVDVFMQHREGPHWHEYSCGWQTREAAIKAAGVKCDPGLNEHLIECSAVRVWNPQGAEADVQ